MGDRCGSRRPQPLDGQFACRGAGAVGKLWEEYFSRLMSCARRTLKRISRRAIDEKNVALSAIVSFSIATEAARRTSAPQLCHARLYWIGRR